MQTLQPTKLKWKLNAEQKKELVETYCQFLNQGVPAGVSVVSIICKKYNIDHSTVYYHLKRARVFSDGKTREIRTVQQIITPRKNVRMTTTRSDIYFDFDDEPINKGHDYSHYVKEQKDREWKEFLNSKIKK